MAEIPGTVTLSGIIAPSDDQDTYAVTEDIWNKGGHRSVATIADRDAITSDRRKEGMLCFVEQDQKTYQLVNGSWVEFSGSSGGGDKTYTHTQGVASTQWIIPHNLNKNVSVTVVDTGNTVVEGEVIYTDFNNVTLNFSAPFTGQAFCN